MMLRSLVHARKRQLAAGMLVCLTWLGACGDDSDPATNEMSGSIGIDPDASQALPGADGGAAPAAPAAPAEGDLGKGDGSDVITIGDSWMSLGGRQPAIQEGLLAASGQPYRTYGIGGTRLLAGSALLRAIPDQYVQAKTENPNIKTVVMTGGGNDIIQVAGLREDCAVMGMMCGQVVTDVLNRLSNLWAEMAADGVRDVVYVQYATPAGENVDFALPDGDGVARRCASVPAPLRCHRVETLGIVMGDIPDGIHPSGVASGRIGQAVFDLMVTRGMRR